MIRILILTLLSTSSLIAQQLQKFDFSNCLAECRNDSSAIEEISAAGHLTHIKVKTYAPCNGNFAGGIQVSPGFVNLKFWTRPTVVTEKNGKVSELLEIADCNCVFRFVYEIKGLGKIDYRSIRINGKTLKQIDSMNILTEIPLDLDSLNDH